MEIHDTGEPPKRRVHAWRSGPRKQKTFFIPEELDRALKLYCVTHDTDETKTVIAALKRYLGQE